MKIDHDFEKVLLAEWDEARQAFEVIQGGLDFEPVDTSGKGARSNKIKNKERAAYTKKKRDALRSDGKSHPDLFDTKYKYCGRCKRQEEIVGECGYVQEPAQAQEITKFKYCSKCDICYCSKKCQTDDWEDHKWICGMSRLLNR